MTWAEFWIAPWWSAVGAAGQWAAALITLFVLWVAISRENRLTVPKLEVTFEPGRDIKLQNLRTGIHGEPGGERESSWLRFRVVNVNPNTIARNCQAVLTRIQRRLPDGGFEEVLFNESRPLLWMHGQMVIQRGDPPEMKDLMARVGYWVDLIDWCPTLYPGGPRVLCRPAALFPETPTTLILTVQVAAERSALVKMGLEVRWDGDFSTLTGRQLH